MNCVRLATTESITLSGTGQTIDDVMVGVNERVLVKNQSTAAENGIYLAAAGSWTRATDLDSDQEACGQVIQVEDGTANGRTAWQCADYPSDWRQVVDLAGWQALSDADQTLLAADGRRWSQAALTANRTKTLSVTGAQLGDLMTIERTDTSHFRLMIVASGTASESYPLDRPGLVRFRFDGSSWHHELPDSDMELVFRPEDYGAKGDGTADDTAAIQAMLDAASAAVTGANRYSNRILKLKGSYRVTSDLQYIGNDGNNVIFQGDVGLNGAVQGTAIVRDGDVGASFFGGGSTSITVNAASNTIQRASGSWTSAPGGTRAFAAGMYIMVNTPLNVRQCKITSLTSTTITVASGSGLVNETTSNAEVLEMNAVLRLVGAHRCQLRDLEIRGAEKVLFGVHIWIDQDSVQHANSSGNTIERCTIFAPRTDAIDAACLAIGARSRSPIVGSQCDTIIVRDSILYANPAFVPSKGCGWKTLDGNNTKAFEIHATGFIGCRRCVDWEYASGSLLLSRGSFESSDVAVYANGYVTLVSCNAERVGRLLEGTATSVSATVENSEINLKTDDSWIAVSWLGQLAMRGGHLANFRAQRVVNSVNTGTNTITYQDGEITGQLAAGEKVVVRCASGGSLPEGLYEDRVYKVLSAGGSGPSSWTMTVEDPTFAPGVAVDLKSAGSSVQLASLPLIKMGDYGAAASSVSLDGALIVAAYEWAPITNSSPLSPFEHLLTPYYSLGSGNPCRVTVGGCAGGITGGLRPLRDLKGNYPQLAAVQPNVTFYVNQLPLRYGAAVSRGVVCYELLASRLTTELPSASTATNYIGIPPRTRIVGVIADTEQAWAGTGITDADLDLADAGGAAGDILRSHDVDVVVTKGLVDGDLGGRIDRANASSGGWMPAAGWSAFWNVVVTLTVVGSTFSALTAGRTRIYLVLERYPDPAKV